MSETKKAAKKMPKGGRKGGAMFPRMDLDTAVGYAKRLVSKTHTGPQSKEVIYSGVLDASSSVGNVKLSALKQYGFVEGESATGFSASSEAKALAAAPPEELVPHYRAAVLRPKVFKALFETYHGDSVNSGKLKQRAAALNVHPDETETCVDIYLRSAQLARLVTPEGDLFKHIADSQIEDAGASQSDKQEEDPTEDKGTLDPAPSIEQEKGQQATDQQGSDAKSNGGDGEKPSSPRAIFNVNVTLDSSLDTEKLQKQLELLKKYGAI